MIYEIKESLKVSDENEIRGEVPYVKVSSLEAWEKQRNPELEGKIRNFEQITYCKLEEESECLWGTFIIPVKNNIKEKRRFFYIIEKKRISFIDDTGMVESLLNKIAENKTWKKSCIESFLYTFLESLISNDFIFLQEMENRLAKIEDSVLNGGLDNFNHKMMAIRKELSIWHNYYSQLFEMSRKMRENESEFFKEDGIRLFELFSDHVTSLQNSTQFLREYAIQIREVYQAQIDIKQNKIMEILTIVTTLFLPLTLITGWYGMNFEYMPELKWKYGYPAMILGSVIVVIVCMEWFKKKKFL